MKNKDKSTEETLNKLFLHLKKEKSVQPKAPEQKKVEKKPRNTGDFLHNIIESSLDGIIATDDKGYITRANKAFLEMLKYEEDDVVGKHITEFSIREEGVNELITGDSIAITKEYFDNQKAMIASLLEGGEIRNRKSYFACKDGKIVPCEQNISALYDEEGTINGAVGIIRDITERVKSERNVAEIREFLDNIFKTAADGIIVTDHNGFVIMINDSLEKITGYNKEDLIGKHAKALRAEGKEYEEKGIEFAETLLKDGMAIGSDIPWLRKDGSLVYVERSAALLRNKDGEISGAVSTIRDITERKKAEEELKESKEYLDNLIETSLDCIMVSDKTGYITKVNRYFLDLLGYSAEEVIGKHVMECTPMLEEGTFECTTGEILKIGSEFVDDANKKVENLLKEGKVTNWETYYFRKDRKITPIEQNIVCLYNKQGERTGAVAIIRDITERKQAEEETRKAKDHLDNIIESSLDGIIVADGIGNITRVNGSFLKLVGYEEKEVIGKHIMELSITDSGMYESTMGESVKIDEEFFNDAKKMTYEKLFKEGKITNWETYYLRKDKKIVPIEMNVSYLYSEKGEIIGSVGINRDITERKKIEREIKEAKEFLENVLESSRDGIVITDKGGFILSANSSMGEMTNFTKEELVAKNSSELIVEGEDTTHIIEKIIGEFYEKGFTTFETRHKKKDGKIIDVECNLTMVKDDKGEHIAGISIIRDITERKNTEKEVKEARNFLENVFKTTGDGIIVADSEGLITMANEAAKKTLGYSKEELIGKSTSVFNPVGKEYEEIAERYLEELFEKDTVNAFEFVWLKKDGNLLNVEVNGVLLKDYTGCVTGSVASIRDITERKNAEEALKKSEQRYQNLIEFANIGIIAAENNKITHVNRRAEEIYSYAKEELIGKPPGILTPEKHKDEHRDQLNKYLSSGEVSKIVSEEEGIRKDGSQFPIEISFALTQPDENVVIAIIRDITERKDIEQKLLQSEKLKSLGELSGGVAHDFNNVLAAILGRVQLLKMQFKPPLGKQEKRKSMLDLIKSLDIIERASLDGAETVRRIQEFSRKRADDRDFTGIDINELVDNALEFTSVRWKNDAESKGITITIQKEFSPLPATSGSASELREVFTNLINNAIDAMPQGGRIKIKTFKENGHISITIQDSGVGISEAIRNRIFDPFFTTKGVQSTGLGMSVSYGIINRHGGTIRVDSMEGKGSTFAVTIPISDNIRVEEEKTKPIPEEKRKSTVLVIEDEEEVRNLLADILIENGHQVETASDGNQGIDMLKKKDFDLVFTDLGMPGTSGWEVAETVKSINERIPVAIITGWNVELKESEMREKGVNLIAYKPFKIDQILRLVQEGMELKKQFEAA